MASSSSSSSSSEEPSAGVLTDHEEDSVHLYSEFSLDSEPACYMYGLALLYEVPVPVNDPMALVSKEFDYHRAFSEDGSAGALALQKILEKGTMLVTCADKLEAAWKELNIALTIMENQPNNAIKKTNILSALGEVAFRKGDSSNAQRYYLQALSIWEHWAGTNNKRAADLHVKICICLEDSNRKEAIEHGEKAISIYKTHLKKLIAETSSSSGAAATSSAHKLNLETPSVPATDPSIQQKKRARSELIKTISELLFKIDYLKRGLDQSSASSGSRKGTSGKAIPSLRKLGGISSEDLRQMIDSVASADHKNGTNGGVTSADHKDETDGDVGKEKDGNRSTASEERPLKKDK